MEYKRMSNEELVKLLDEKGIDHSGAKKKDDYIELLKNAPEEDTKVQGLAGTIKSALKVEKTVTKSQEDPYAYLDGRDYDELTYAERLIARERTKVYENVENNGVAVKITKRLTAPWVIKKLNGTFSKFLKGETYVLSKEDFDVLKNEKVKVKTEATKDKCCGQARYEEVPLLEV